MKRWFAAFLFSALLGAQSLSELATTEFEKGDADAAERDARLLLDLAAANAKEWNHDDMIHAANTILGRVAVQRGDLQEAGARLLASARIKGSAVLGSFGPSLKLAQELLVAGESSVVLQYLELCRSFWKNDRGRIDRYVELIRSETSLEAGGRAPAFRLKDLSGKEWALDQLGGQVVALDFWATWCSRCREELPLLEKMAAEFRTLGVVTLVVDVGESEATVRHFVEGNGVILPVLLAGEDVVTLNYRVRSYPALVVLGRNGRIAAYLTGASAETELRQAFEKGIE